MAISEQEIRHLAKLARLELKDKEIKKFQTQLSGIFEYVEKLRQVKDDIIEPIAQITGLKNVSRDDAIEPSDEETRQMMLKQAPKTKGDLIETLGVFE